ncbi:MAG: hypothetical protein OEY80_10400 [Nitrospirota bacterium]|nr:hypothetical protein [Nitrospirota bacterium]
MKRIQNLLRPMAVALAFLSINGVFTVGWAVAKTEELRSVGMKEVQAMVEKTLPPWDEKVLAIKEGGNWLDKLDFNRVFRAFGEKPEGIKFFPADAERVATRDMIVRLDRQAGKVRYINRERAWQFDRHASTKAVESKQALEVVANLTQKLGLPKEEMSQTRVDTQMAGGAPVGSKMIKDLFEMYRVVTISRSVNQLPVYGSQIRAAVSNEGMVQRAQMVWPAFGLSPDLTLRKRPDVVKQTVEEIMAQDPMADIYMKAVLAYALRSQGDEDFRYVPAVIVSVYSSPTPYQLVIPVAENQKGFQGEREMEKPEDK